MENKDRNLYRLDELSDYKVASNYSDVRGWKIVDSDNRTIGKIDNLWVNKDMQRVVYLDVNVDKALIDDNHNEIHDAIAHDNGKEFMYKDGNSHIIIPIGSVSINKDTKIVMANGIGYDTFRKTSRYSHQHNFDRNYERTVMNGYYPENNSNLGNDSDDDAFTIAKNLRTDSVTHKYKNNSHSVKMDKKDQTSKMFDLFFAVNWPWFNL